MKTKTTCPKMTKTMTGKLLPSALDVRIGRLCITQEEDGNGSPRIGYGSTVTIDGIELTGVKEVYLRVRADDITTATVVYVVQPSGEHLT